MSEINVSGTNPTEEAQAASEKQSVTKPQGQPAAAMGGGGDLKKLKERMDAEDPTMWNKWMQAMGTEITNKWRKLPERLKQIRQESERK